MTNICNKCGANLPEDKNCESMFYEFMALEFTDPSYGRVHFLTVASYMIQHEGYSDEMYAWMQSALKQYLEDGRDTEKIREIIAKGPGSTKGIRRSGEAPPLPKVAWSMTIADVAEQFDDPESYCKLIEKWGRTVMKEMGPLVLKK